MISPLYNPVVLEQGENGVLAVGERGHGAPEVGPCWDTRLPQPDPLLPEHGRQLPSDGAGLRLRAVIALNQVSLPALALELLLLSENKHCSRSPLIFSTAMDLGGTLSFMLPLPCQREALGAVQRVSLGAEVWSQAKSSALVLLEGPL